MKKVLATLFMGLAMGSTHAALISSGQSFSPVLQVDGSSSSTSLSISGSGSITDVNVFIDFTKCDNPISSAGACNGSFFSFNREIVFSLTSAQGSVVNLVTEDTYTGQTPGARVSVLFDDAAATAVGGSVLTSGTFSPVGSLSALNGEAVSGSWTLGFQDTAGADPLSLNAWRLDITTDSDAIPEPTGLALLGLGLAGLGFARKRKSS